MSRSSRLLAILSAIALFLVPATVGAQGVLVVVDPNVAVRLPRPIVIHPPHVRPEPIPPASYQIQELDVQARIVDQVAQVQVSQSFVNTGSRVLEVSFLFPLPYDGAVEQMTLLVDGKEHPARLLKADEARRLYEEIVRKNRDPALLEWMGTGLFRTSVFPVPPGQKRTVSLRYSQLCRKQEGLTDFLFPLSTAKYTAKPVEKVQLRVTIESQTAIKNVYSPSHAVEIQRPSDRHATVTYTLKNEVPTSDFRLLYDVGQGKVSARVLSYRPSRSGDAEGYFLLLASPEIKKGDGELRKKTVVFVIDRSGSMSGKKIEQVRGALKFVLENLRKGDLFNIVAYDSQVESFRPELQRFDKQTRQAALGFVEGLYAGGSTNIEGALRTALDQLQDSGQPNFVVFLTDGLPTTGVTQEGAIAQSATRTNRVRARLFTFGVGYDVNSRLLDKLARENHGSTEYVRPNEDIEDRVSRLYRRIGAPVMTDVKLEFSLDEHRQGAGSPTSRVYPKGAIDLFAGDQLAVVGRYRTGGEAKVVVSGSVSGRTEKFDFPARLVAESGDETNAFIEKLWAARRVGEILEEIDAQGQERRVDPRAGRAFDAPWNPHSLHLVSGGREHAIGRPGGQRHAHPGSTGSVVRDLRRLGRRTACLPHPVAEGQRGGLGADRCGLPFPERTLGDRRGGRAQQLRDEVRGPAFGRDDARSERDARKRHHDAPIGITGDCRRRNGRRPAERAAGGQQDLLSPQQPVGRCRGDRGAAETRRARAAVQRPLFRAGPPPRAHAVAVSGLRRAGRGEPGRPGLSDRAVEEPLSVTAAGRASSGAAETGPGNDARGGPQIASGSVAESAIHAQARLQFLELPCERVARRVDVLGLGDELHLVVAADRRDRGALLRSRPASSP